MRKILTNPLSFISIAIAATSAIHWAAPAALGGGIISIAALIIVPETIIALFLHGVPLIKGIIMSDRVLLSWLILMLAASIALIGIFAKKKIRLPRIDLFQVAVFLLMAWIIISLLWSKNLPEGFHKLRTWIITGLVPMELCILLSLSGLSLKRIPEISVYMGIVLIVLSAFALQGASLGPLSRFGISGEGSEWNYARSMGFLFITSVWLIDKSHPLKRILFAGVAIISLYFLIISAVRAPFGAALFVTAMYVLISSKIRLSLKLTVGIVLIGSAIYLMRGSFMFMRWISLGKTIELSTSIRFFMWKTAFRHISEIPPWGIGFGSWRIYLPQLLKSVVFHHPHNSILEQYVELGLPGIILFLSIMLFTPIKALFVYLKGKSILPISFRYQLEFALLIWAYGLINGLVNDSLSGAKFEWIALGMMYALILKFRSSLSDTALVQHGE